MAAEPLAPRSRRAGVWLGPAVLAFTLVDCEGSTLVDLLPGAGKGGDGATSSPEGAPTSSSTSGDSGTFLVQGLIHRYDFSGEGTVLSDLVGGRHGSILGGAGLSGAGTLELDGVDDYVVLPPGMISSLGSVTLVAWFTWRSTRAWERVFDFGQTEARDGKPGWSISHFFFSPLWQGGTGTSANFSIDGNTMYWANGTIPFPRGIERQIAVMFDGTRSVIESYVNLELHASKPTPPPLSQLIDNNCWLGQSQQSWDLRMNGVYNEFRIYARVLTTVELGELLAAGPDQP
jgi:hypothetical protein